MGGCVTVFHKFAESEAVWRNALETCTGSIFQTYEWLSTWLDTVGPTESARACIVQVSARDGGTVLLIPLGIYARTARRSLEFLGGDLTDYNMPLVDPARPIGAADMALLWDEILARVPRVDLVRLTRMPLAFDGVPNPLAGLGGLEHQTNAYGASLPRTFDALTALRSTQFFSQNRRYRRRLEKLAPVRVAFPEEDPERLAILRFLLDHKARWQQAAGLPDTLARAENAAFYERMTRTSLREGSVGAPGLWVGEELVAGLWGAISAAATLS